MSKKDKKIILIAQCLINPYCRVHILGQNFPLSQELTNYLMGKKVGIIQYSCPETTAMGLQRNPQGRQQYDSVFFRNHCKELLKIPMLMAREFIKNNYRLTCFIGLENSPTCGIHWGEHKGGIDKGEGDLKRGGREGGCEQIEVGGSREGREAEHELHGASGIVEHVERSLRGK